MPTLSIETEDTRDVSVMKVKGRVDSETAPDLDRALSKLQKAGKTKIVLNLQDVDFLSSAGLRAMVKALKGTQSSGGDVRLASVSKPIEVILRTVGMLQMFKIYGTNEEAAAEF
jgi:anti-sigma B factor antagonist